MYRMIQIGRVVLAGVLAGAALALLSFLVNDVALGAEHGRHTFFRPHDHALVVPGLPITSLAWGLLLALAYRVFGACVRVAHPVARGAVFGLAVYALLVLVHELFYFQFIAMTPLILAGGILHYALAYAAAGAIAGALVTVQTPRRALPSVASSVPDEGT
jgi:hypothetical protein